MNPLNIAINCIKTMKMYGTYNGEKIGRVTNQISQISHYKGGEIVLFREDLYPDNSQVHMGEYSGMQQKPTGTITLEKPLSPEELLEAKARGSLIATTSTIVHVPKKFVKEIIPSPIKKCKAILEHLVIRSPLFSDNI